MINYLTTGAQGEDSITTHTMKFENVTPELLLKYRSIDKNGCWNWSWSRNTKGYGMITNGVTSRMVSHFSYLFWKGKIKKGLCVLHKCDNPPCFNPEHLFLGTKLDNARDMISKGRVGRRAFNRAKLSEKNVIEIRYIWKKGRTTQRKLAAKFGVSFQHISAIVNNKQWIKASDH
jgi:hypothetical protein